LSHLRIRRPSPRYGRVGSRDYSFGACSGFTRVAARRLAGPPTRAVVRVARRSRLPKDRPPVATRLNRPTASAGLPPARTRHLCTAHHNVQMFPTWPQHIRSSFLGLRSAADSIRCPNVRGHVGRSERSERSRKHSCYMTAHRLRAPQTLVPGIRSFSLEFGSTRFPLRG